MDAVKSGANLVQVDRFGLTALHHAAICGHAEVVGYILINSKFNFPSALICWRKSFHAGVNWFSLIACESSSLGECLFDVYYQ